MKYKITQIEFDFDDDYDEEGEISDELKEEIYDDGMFRIWEVEEEEELVDEITDYSGWCVKSIDYQEVI